MGEELRISTKIINHLCKVVPQTNEVLLTKFSNLIYSLLSRQQIVLSEASPVTDYLSGCLQQYGDNSSNELLRALGAVLYENSGTLSEFHHVLAGPGSVLAEVGFMNEALLRSAIQCLENICIKVPSLPYLPEECHSACLHAFLKVLQLSKPTKMDDLAFSQTLISALRGLQHILFVTKSSSSDSLGPLLAALKVYMLYGLTETPIAVPTSLYPMPMGKYDSSNSTTATRKPAQKTPRKQASSSGGQDGVSGSGGAGKKNRRKRQQKGKSSQASASDLEPSDKDHDSTVSTVSKPPAGLFHVSEDLLAQYPAWSKASSSESEWSDAEGGGGSGSLSHARSVCTKVRQAALGCFYALVKTTEKRLMFGFWPSFIPDMPGIGPIAHRNTLFTVIMKDPSARARTGALAVLTALVDGHKQYLMVAEDSEQYRNAPFTPFSVTLGYMIKEIHRSLLLCLVSEQSHLAITQIIKCLATFIPNVPYHRLKPGLLTRVMKQIKPFMSHRDPNIRVVCLSCLGSIVSVQAPLLEVSYILNPPKTGSSGATASRTVQQLPDPTTLATDVKEQEQEVTGVAVPTSSHSNHQESGYHSNMSGLSGSVGSTDGGLAVGMEGMHLGVVVASEGSGGVSPSNYGTSPLAGIQTPNVSSSGLQTPLLLDGGAGMPLGGGTMMSWVVRATVKNVAVHLLEKPQHEAEVLPSKIAAETSVPRIPARTGEGVAGMTTQRERYVQPLPVRLESLQVLASMCKGYFEFLRPSLMLIRDVIQCGLEESDKSMQLHSAKLLDELSSVMSSKLQPATNPTDPSVLNTNYVLDFWLPLLNGPIPNALQTQENLGMRSTLCDCLANISAPVFEKLPEEKHILCITLLLGLSNDEDRNVRAACVRTLGVLVLYPCMREDVSFLADAANVIIQAMEETIINVKFKATWSLGNLTDALVTNREIGSDPNFTDEFCDTLLLKLFDVATRGAADVDKIRANAIRAVGNLLRYLPERCFKSSRFNGAPLVKAVQTLIKNATTGIVKVRWNACYAIGNLFKNPSISFVDQSWTTDVFEGLSEAVSQCKNFKVRINAALALGVPTDRRIYGTSKHYAQMWESLTISLKSSEDSTDLSEYKYRDSLAQQVIQTLIQLVGMATAADIKALASLMQREKDWLQTYMCKYRTSIQGVLDKESELTGSESHLKQLVSGLTELDGEQRETVTSLTEIFTLTPPTQISEKPASLFVQTYD